MKIDFSVRSEIDLTPRVKQLSGMFDVPLQEKLSHDWRGDAPIEMRDWNVGLIVGPSGSGKSSVARQMFGDFSSFNWSAKSIIDDFSKDKKIAEITDVCSSVGFNTIPSWMKPHAVLSTGEKFRAELARHLLESADPVVVDEFTSVVDRQVAQIGSHAVQKYIRKHQRKFVAVSCHYDILDWLQPDWVLEPATMNFQWRSVQRRPALNIEIARVHHSAWRLFSKFHYLTRDLHRAANCFLLSVNGTPATFCGVLHKPHPLVNDIKGISRIVTLPDYQGLGLAMVLTEKLGQAYKALGQRFRNYPAHPAFVRAHDRSPQWAMIKAPGIFSSREGATSSTGGTWGGRPCAVFQYEGPAGDKVEAAKLITG